MFFRHRWDAKQCFPKDGYRIRQTSCFPLWKKFSQDVLRFQQNVLFSGRGKEALLRHKKRLKAMCVLVWTKRETAFLVIWR
ncbi:hypothetical protein CGS59_03185 [Faecalibacterium prausnitzii]|uniref:Uncharacterized protein n=1 Tax=Faecalibacterium prausnitzii TaxID=853 RepID=A0A2A7B0F8_9FIRM|nr:hypothetical protein CGS59_03185 [Faecalibacterium prausnitzii]